MKVVVLFFFLCAPLLSNAKDFIIAIEANVEKFIPNFKNDIAVLYKRIGVDVKFVILPSKRSLSEFQSGDIDAMGLRIGDASKVLKDHVKVTPPLIEDVKMAEFKLNGSQNTANEKTVGCIRGSIYCQKYESLFKTKVTLYAESFRQLIRTLKAKRVSHIILPSMLVKNFNFKDLVQTKNEFNVQVFHFLQKRNKELKDKLAKEIRKMKKEKRFFIIPNRKLY